MKVEQQAYRSCMGVLKFADKHTAECLENACEKVLSLTPTPSYKNVKNILTTWHAEVKKEEPVASNQFGITRGTDYYRR